MAKVRKNKRANYWEVDYLDLFGKRKVKGGFKTKVEAEAFMVDILSKVQTGTMPKNNKMTFSEAADIFMRLHANKKCKPNTEHGYHGYLKNHLLFLQILFSPFEISPTTYYLCILTLAQDSH